VADPEARIEASLDSFKDVVFELKDLVKGHQKTISGLLVTQGRILTQLKFQWWVIGSMVTLNIGMLWFVANKI